MSTILKREYERLRDLLLRVEICPDCELHFSDCPAEIGLCSEMEEEE